MSDAPQMQIVTRDAVTVVVVNRKEQDGWFVYTSDDIPGLYVASHDDQAAYDDIPASIRLLVRLNDGVESEVEAIRDRMVTEMGACGKPEDCHRAAGGCCALGDATVEYQQGISDA